jgi:hypothetical protein
MESIMQLTNLGRATAVAALALCAILISLDVSMAKPKDISGNYNCYCDGGNQGTCTTVPGDGNLKCEKGSSDTCTGTCKMISFSKGAVGGAVMQGGGGGNGGGVGSPGNAR